MQYYDTSDRGSWHQYRPPRPHRRREGGDHLLYDFGTVLNHENMKESQYEIHVTVANPGQDLKLFKEACKEAGVKPIIIELQDEHGGVFFHDVMTSGKIKDRAGSAEEINHHINFIRDCMGLRGLKVVRTKVEAHPDNEYNAAPIIYHESHIRVKTTADEIPRLRTLATGGLHVSRNIFKHLPGDKRYIMLTYRSKTTSTATFRDEVAVQAKRVSDAGFEYDKLEIEAVIHDNNKQHDVLWAPI